MRIRMITMNPTTSSFLWGCVAGAIFSAGAAWSIAYQPGGQAGEAASDLKWKGAAGEIYPVVGADPFASDDALSAFKQRNESIQRAHDFVVYHKNLPGRDLVLEGLAGYQAALAEQAVEDR